MTKRFQINLIFFVLLLGYGITAYLLRQEREGFIDDQFVQYTIPSEFMKPLSLEFRGLTSDFLLVKFMTFIGGRTQQLDQFESEDWDAVRSTLDTITDLDPYYWDAYLFAQVFLTWDGTHYEDANKLLLKAWKYIPDDYRIPYYIGLNYYNFGKDAAKGSQYLMEASRLPGSPFYLASLAARLAAYGSDYQRGIIFLNEMLRQTTNPEIVEQYKLRIQTLERMNLLAKAVTAFSKQFNRFPSNLDELLEEDMIAEVPKDPYGGRFYIKENGQIHTTSKMLK